MSSISLVRPPDDSFGPVESPEEAVPDGKEGDDAPGD
jgi:hypothetical protein